MKTIVFVLVSLIAAAASAQELPKVWRDTDLVQPLALPHQMPDPAALAGFRARAAQPLPLGILGSLRAPEPSVAQSGPSDAIERTYARELKLQRATAPPPPQLYAPQPLYPFVTVIYSNGPQFSRRVEPPIPPACPVPIRVRR